MSVPQLRQQTSMKTLAMKYAEAVYCFDDSSL